MFFIVVFLSVYFISNIWLKWKETPIIITLSSKSYSIKDLPFPALTISNMKQVKNSVVRNMSIDSPEYDVVKSLCRRNVFYENETISRNLSRPFYRDVLLKGNFLFKIRFSFIFSCFLFETFINHAALL